MDELSQVHRIFSYGSNLDPDRFRSRARYWDGKYQLARLPGYELRFNKRSSRYGVAANVVPHPTRHVPGILVDLNDADLTAIDAFEGYPSNYDRISTKLLLEDNSEADGYVYIATPQWIQEGSFPSEDYLGYVTRGAIASGLPDSYIQAIARLGKKIA